MDERPTLPTNRRRLLQGIGLAAGGQFLPEGLGLLQGQSYVLEQGDQCVPVEPLSGRGSAASFYDYETGNGSRGTTGLQREDTSLLFLYRGPDRLSLFVVHGKMGGSSDGGAATFRLSGLPSDGEWVVRDDDYNGSSQKDNWSVSDGTSTIDWTWVGSLTDGGVFSGLGDDFEVRIEPRFNRRAELFGSYAGTVSSWELLSGNPDDPERVELDMSRPVTIRTGSCDGGGSLLGGSTGDGGGKQADEDEPGRRRGQDGGKPGNDDPGPPGDDGKKGRKDEKERKTSKEQKERRKEQRAERKEQKEERKEERKERREERKEERKEERRAKAREDDEESLVQAEVGDDGVGAEVDLGGDDEDDGEDGDEEEGDDEDEGDDD